MQWLGRYPFFMAGCRIPLRYRLLQLLVLVVFAQCRNLVSVSLEIGGQLKQFGRNALSDGPLPKLLCPRGLSSSTDGPSGAILALSVSWK
jgi:hypothetical protein